MSDPTHAAPSRPEPVLSAARQAGWIAGLVSAVDGSPLAPVGDPSMSRGETA